MDMGAPMLRLRSSGETRPGDRRVTVDRGRRQTVKK